MRHGFLSIAIVFIAVSVASSAHASPTLPTDAVFQIAEIERRARLNHKLVDEARPLPCEIGQLWRTKKGRNTVYKFVHSGWANGKNGPFKAHWILLLEVDRKKRIVDGYFYILEWADGPTPVYRVTAKGLTLRDQLPLRDLKLIDDEDIVGRTPRKDGILDNVYRAKTVF